MIASNTRSNASGASVAEIAQLKEEARVEEITQLKGEARVHTRQIRGLQVCVAVNFLLAVVGLIVSWRLFHTELHGFPEVKDAEVQRGSQILNTFTVQPDLLPAPVHYPAAFNVSSLDNIPVPPNLRVVESRKTRSSNTPTELKRAHSQVRSIGLSRQLEAEDQKKRETTSVVDKWDLSPARRRVHRSLQDKGQCCYEGTCRNPGERLGDCTLGHTRNCLCDEAGSGTWQDCRDIVSCDDVEEDGSEPETEVEGADDDQSEGEGPIKFPTASKCHTKPTLEPNNNRTFEVLTVAQHVLGQAAWQDKKDSFYYDAICWIINDDERQLDPSSDAFIQRLVMALFYFSTNSYEVEDYRTAFLQSLEETEWFDNEHDGDATMRTLRAGGLQGTLIPELSHLTQLETLDLRGNKLIGTIPNVYGELSNLKILDLSHNNLSGTIEGRLFEARNLQKLSLGSNALSGGIPTQIGHLSNVSDIRLEDNLISGPIPEELFNCLDLEYLSVQSNQLTGTISSRIGQLSQIEQFDVHNNSLTGTLPKTFSQNILLKYLDLSQNRLSDEIPSQVWDLPFHKEGGRLYLENNNLHGLVPRHSCEAISRFHQIQVDCHSFFGPPKVECTCCKRCGEARRLSNVDSHRECRGSKLQLRTSSASWLEIDWTITDITNGQDISSSLLRGQNKNSVNPTMCVPPTSCFRLTISSPAYRTNVTVVADENVIAVRTIETFTNPSIFFGYNVSLAKLQENACSSMTDLCGASGANEAKQRQILNHVVEISELGPNFFSLQGDQRRRAVCDTARHNFQIDDLEDLRNGTAYQRFICTLLHYQNGVWSQEALERSTICDLKGVDCDPATRSVVALNFDNFGLSGTLPEELGGLASLRKLSLGSNNLSGSIAQQFESLASLTDFDLKGNFITGALPDVLPPGLKKFDVSGNLIEGTLPGSISSLSSLENFSVASNLISGTIPSEIEGAAKLKLIDLSDNKMAGSIPVTLYSLKNLDTLRLNGNNLSGTLSGALTTLSQLAYLHLQNNLLSGTLPPHMFSNGSKLRAVGLNNNEFKGSIPVDASQAKRLEFLHLHGNSLTGSAPKLYSIPSSSFGYISDCGLDFGGTAAVECEDCQMCCNSEEECYMQEDSNLTIAAKTGIFVLCLVGFVLLLFSCSCSTQSKRLTSRSIFKEDPVVLCGSNSVYWLVLSDDSRGWFLFVFTAIIQCGVFSLFIYSAFTDRKTFPFFFTCPPEREDCEDIRSVDAFGWLAFGVLMAVYVALDFAHGIVLVVKAGRLRNPRVLVSGGLLLLISAMAVWTSVYYNISTAMTNIDLVVNAVVLLFVNEVDERIYAIIRGIAPHWTEKLQRKTQKIWSDKENAGPALEINNIAEGSADWSPGAQIINSERARVEADQGNAVGWRT